MDKILVIGPSPEKSKGGMATVIQGIKNDQSLKENFEIDIHDSYIDGRIITRLLFSVYAFLKFYFTKRKYDIYHIHAACGRSTFRKGCYSRMAKKWGKKVIFHIHGGRYMEFYNEVGDKKKGKIRRILLTSDLVVALSEGWKIKFGEAFGLKNCVVVENGIDMSLYQSAIVDLSQCQAAFLMLGRMSEEKGTFDLIDAIELAIKKVPNIMCYLAGDGEIEKMKQIVEHKQLGNNIKVVGWVDYQKKIKLLQKVSTVVLPSYNEGLPMSILEGMASGKAIISTTVGAIPEVVSPKNGILTEPGNIVALADALIECSLNIKMLVEMSKNNLKKIEESFSGQIMHKKLIDIYKYLDYNI